MQGERERHLNTPSATSKPPCPDLIPSINLIMEQIDLKDDSTGMSTVVGTDSLAFAKGLDFRVHARIRSVLYPHLDSAHGPSAGWTCT